MNVERIMSRPVHCCRPEDTLDKVVRTMREADCGCVPVLDAQQRLIGIVTDRDICLAAEKLDARLCEVPVRRVMTTHVLTCLPDDDIAFAEAMMRERQVRRLPVLDAKGHVLGMVSLNDLAREAAREASQRRPEVTSVEIAKTLAAICRPKGDGALVISH